MFQENFNPGDLTELSANFYLLAGNAVDCNTACFSLIWVLPLSKCAKILAVWVYVTWSNLKH